MLKGSVVPGKHPFEIPALKHDHPLSNGFTRLRNLKPNHWCDRRMTTKYKLNLLFDDHYRESSNGISNSDDIGSIEIDAVPRRQWHTGR